MSASAGPYCPRDGALTVEGPAPELAPGSKVFDRFELGEVVARGNTGTIYRARDEAGAHVALKVIHVELTRSPVDRSRIRRELTKATSVTHPHIVRVLEVGETGGRIFLVREFVEGDALVSLLRRDGPMDVPQASRVVHDIAAALVEAHRAGVLHRDLNGRHVLIRGDGSPALLDFALAAPLPGGIGGKPAFGSHGSLAPEQAAGKLVTLRADLYALGLVFREMLTGEPTRLPDDPAAALAARAEEDAPAAPPGAPPAIANLMAQLLARDPKDRPFGARAVEKVLAELSGEAGRPSLAPAPAPMKPAVRFHDDGAPAFAAPPRTATLPPQFVTPEVPPEGTDPPRPDATERDVRPPPRVSPTDETVVTAAPTLSPPSALGQFAALPTALPGAPRASKKTLIGIPLPMAPESSTAVRQKWARSVLGLAEDEESPSPTADQLGLPASLDPPRRIASTHSSPHVTAPPAPAAPPPAPAAPPVDAAAPVGAAAPSAVEAADAPREIAAAPQVSAGAPPVVPAAAPPVTTAAPPPPPMPRESPSPSLVLSFDDDDDDDDDDDHGEAAPAFAPAAPPLPSPDADEDLPDVSYVPAPIGNPPVAVMSAPAAAGPMPALAPRESARTEPPAEPTRGARSSRSRLVTAGVVGIALCIVVGVVLATRGGGAGHPATEPAAAAQAATPTTPDGPAAPTAAPAPPPPAAPTPSGAILPPAPTAAPAAPTSAAPPAPAAAQADDDPRSNAELIKYARANVRKRRWTEARRAFERVLAREVDNLDALLGAALVAVSEHRYERAIEHFEHAIRLRPTSATFQVYLGNAHLMNHDRARAEASWRRALELDPGQREARQRLGLAPLRAERRAPRRRARARENPYR